MIAGREPGTTCGITYRVEHGEPPVEGDLLVTRAGSSYRIDAARPIAGNPRRLRLRCTRLERHAVALGEPGVFSLAWDGRRRA